MIGSQLESQRRLPAGAVVMSLAAIVLLALSVGIGSYHLAMLAILPLCLAVAIFAWRPKSFLATVTETGLDVDQPRTFLDYSAIEELVVRGAHPRAEIRVASGEHVLTIPAGLNFRSDAVLDLLAVHIPASGSRSVHARLAGYLERMIGVFGPERVFSYCARRGTFAYRYRRLAGYFFAMATAAGLWFVIGIAAHGAVAEPWMIVGMLLMFMFFVFGLAFWFARDGGNVKNRSQSSLIIAPPGLALLQGDLCGEVLWNEVTDVRIKRGDGSLASVPQVQLRVPGAMIVIFDLYDRPISWIHARIIEYWRDPDANA